MHLSLEKAFLEGQKTALYGDARIKWNETRNAYEWIKSPWNDKTPPLYIPHTLGNKFQTEP